MMEKIQIIPRVLLGLLRVVTPEAEWPHIQGDYEEIYRDLRSHRGRSAALIWLLRQIATASLIHFSDILYWSFAMLKNIIKISLRLIRKQLGYSLINIFGLAVGLACCLLIFLWVGDETSFDRFHEKRNRIYRVLIQEGETNQLDKTYAVSPITLAPAVKSDIPGVTNAVRMTGQSLALLLEDEPLPARGLMVGPEFLDMFSFPLIQGHIDTALDSINKIILTESLAERCFGTEDPVGRTIKTIAKGEFIVSGIMKDPPRQSHVGFEFLINFEWLGQNGRDLNRWTDMSFFNYVELGPNVDPAGVEQAITDLARPRLEGLPAIFKLQPLTEIYFSPAYQFDMIAVHGSRQSVLLFSIIAVGILFIACINFVNLSTARSGRRAREVGLRKVVGAQRKSLVLQFFGESLMITGLAGFLALGLITLLLPAFGSLTGKAFNSTVLLSRTFLPGILGSLFFTGLASGAYPALLLSSFRPVGVLKGSAASHTKGSLLRKALILFQFALTIAVLISVLVTNRQLDYLSKKDLGYDKNNLLVFSMSRIQARQYETLKAKLQQNPAVDKVAAAAGLPTELRGGSVASTWDGKTGDEQIHFKMFWVDPDYCDTFGMTMAEGKFFNHQSGSQDSYVVVNEAAVRAIGMADPIGKRITFGRDNIQTVIGVVKDYHFRSLHHAIEPMALFFAPSMINTMIVRLNQETADLQGFIGEVKGLWKEIDPKTPFRSVFYDEVLNRLYVNEKVTSRLFTSFTALAIFISCLGLVGMASFTAEQRTKEIGIRKVLGASFGGIFLLLVKEFTKWVLLANVIAWPVGFIIMKGWLKSFAYHAPMSAWIFPAAGLLALALAVVTVSWQTIRSSLVTPLKSLRYE